MVLGTPPRTLCLLLTLSVLSRGFLGSQDVPWSMIESAFYLVKAQLSSHFLRARDDGEGPWLVGKGST